MQEQECSHCVQDLHLFSFFLHLLPLLLLLRVR